MRLRMGLSTTVLICLHALGCTSTTTQTRVVSGGQRDVLVAPQSGQSSVNTAIELEAGLVRGRVVWADRCRQGTEERFYDEILDVKTPNYKAGVTALVVGSLIGTLSGALLSASKELSDTEQCGPGLIRDYGCSSPREDVMAIGVLGLAGGIGLAGAGLLTFGTRPIKRVERVIEQPPRLIRVAEGSVPCGLGPVPGMGVELVRGADRLSASTTNADGRFALVIPERFTGPMTVVVSSVPPGTALLAEGARLAYIDVPAIAPSLDDSGPPPVAGAAGSR